MVQDCVLECNALRYTDKDFEKKYLERKDIQNRLLQAVLNNKLIWIDGPGGSGKTTLANWLTRKLLTKHEYRILPVIIDVEAPPSIYTDESFLEWMLEQAIKSILSSTGIPRKTVEEIISRVREAVDKNLDDILDAFGDLASILMPYGNILLPLAKLFYKLYKFIKKTSQTQKREDKINRIVGEIQKEIEKLKELKEYTNLLLILDDLGSIKLEDFRSKTLLLLKDLADKCEPLKVVVVRRRFETTGPSTEKIVREGRKPPGWIGEEEEEILLKCYNRVIVEPLSLEESDKIEALIKILGYTINEEEKKEIIRKIFSKTMGAPRHICIALCLIAGKTGKKTITLEDLEQMPDTWRKIFEIYIDKVCIRYGGVNSSTFSKVLRTASIMPMFGQEELIEVVKNVYQPTDIEDSVNSFLSSPLVTLAISEEKVYSFSREWTWFSEEIEEAILTKDEWLKLNKATLKYFSELKERDPRVDIATVYHARRLLSREENEEERRKLKNIILEPALRIANMCYMKNLSRYAIDYGLLAYNTAINVRKPLEALIAAEIVLKDIPFLVKIATEYIVKIANSIANSLDGLYKEAQKINIDQSSYYYAFAYLHWAGCVLYVLDNPAEAEKAIEKALGVIGSPNNKLIRDENLWYSAYFAVLRVKAELARVKGQHGEVKNILNEMWKLLEGSKNKITERYYYNLLSYIEDMRGRLIMEDTADFQEAKAHFEKAISASLKAKSTTRTADLRLDIARIQIMLGQFNEVDKDIEGLTLSKALKEFVNAGEIEGTLRTLIPLAISHLALKNDDKALREAMKACKIGMNPYKNYESYYANLMRALFLLLLAYVMLVSKLEKFKQDQQFREIVMELTLRGLHYSRSLKYFLGRIILDVELYILNVISMQKLIGDMKIALKRAVDRNMPSVARVLDDVIRAIEEQGVTEEVLRKDVVKIFALF